LPGALSSAEALISKRKEKTGGAVNGSARNDRNSPRALFFLYPASARFFFSVQEASAAERAPRGNFQIKKPEFMDVSI